VESLKNKEAKLDESLDDPLERELDMEFEFFLSKRKNGPPVDKILWKRRRKLEIEAEKLEKQELKKIQETPTKTVDVIDELEDVEELDVDDDEPTPEVLSALPGYDSSMDLIYKSLAIQEKAKFKDRQQELLLQESRKIAEVPSESEPSSEDSDVESADDDESDKEEPVKGNGDVNRIKISLYDVLEMNTK
jgi:hypothetical protein